MSELVPLTLPRVRLAVAGAFAGLEARKQDVNNLNVYPVPDGDTGTNLSLTLKSILDDLDRASEPLAPEELCALVEEAALMGARGNSGVILSQMARGAAQALGELGGVGAATLPAVLRRATDTAYRAIRRPVEGTMLTVLREMTEAAEAAPPDLPLCELFARVIQAGWASVERTPHLLKVLADAGVVDAGGFGLVVIIEGLAQGGSMAATIPAKSGLWAVADSLATLPPRDEAYEHAVSPFTYCTSFLVKGQDLDVREFETGLSKFGDSLLVVGGGSQLKVHIHTDEPGTVLSFATDHGTLFSIEIDNMKEQIAARTARLQAEETIVAPNDDSDVEPRVTDVVAVVSGDGNRRLFANLGVTAFVEGGQTMNPSAEQLISAVRRTSSREVVILPNNKNIILAAEQVAGRVADKRVVVVPTKSILQGLSAMVLFDPSLDAHANAIEMEESLTQVTTGEITRAVRDSHIDGLDIRKDAFIGLVNGHVVVCGKDLLEVARAVAERLVTGQSEVMTILIGDGRDGDEARRAAAALADLYGGLQVDVHEGGQPLYPLLLSCE